MKNFIIQILIILIIGISSSFAGNLMMLHVGSQGGAAVADPCAGKALDLSSGCPLPMLGVF